MSMRIDVTSLDSLTDEQREYLQQRNRFDLIALIDANAREDGAASARENEEKRGEKRDNPHHYLHQPAEEVDEDDSYAQWTVEELKRELQARNLSTTGNKSELVERLEADDENSPE